MNSETLASTLNSGDIAWILTSSGLVLLMTPGLAFFYGGMVRKKNMLSTMTQSFITLSLVSILWIVVGFSLAFGESIYGILGNPTSHFFLRNVGLEPNPAFAETIPFLLFTLFQMKFAIITPALITGAFAERIRFSAYLIFVVLFSLLVYAPVAHWAWHPEGFLRKMGVLDFAGGTVVHITAGMAALMGALIMRPRHEKLHEPANLPWVLLGTGMLWFGWFGFNAGSALHANALAVQAFLTTHMASAGGMLTWMLLDWLYKRKFSALSACLGAVVGLVAITPAAGFVSVGASLMIGVFATVVSFYAVRLRSRSSLDDTLDVFPCHGLGGIVGMILTAVFATEGGLIHGETQLFKVHLLGLVVVILYSGSVSGLLYFAIQKFVPLEVSEEEERLGLDLGQHGEQVL